MRMFYTDLGSLSLKETDKVFLQHCSFLWRIFVAGGSLSGDRSGIRDTTLHHKLDLEFGFEALQGGVIS